MKNKSYYWPLILVLGTACLAYGQPVPLWETGQTACYDTAGILRNCSGTGEDGELRRGVAWPDPRFAINGDCVTDKLTGLMWARNANLPDGTRTWQGALDYVASINSGFGLCGHNDWRLPNQKELRSLIDHSQKNLALPLNHPFYIISTYYGLPFWSSSSVANLPSSAWEVYMNTGNSGARPKDNYDYVWPVRSGQN